MSKFPVESDDTEGVRDAINYLLSGPGGLGQNFAGFSAYQTGYLTGNFRVPYSQTTPAELYVAPIACSSAEKIDARTFKYTFSSAQPSPPFALGNNITGAGWSDGFYNGIWSPIGVADCTTTYVIVRTNGEYPTQGDDLGGGTVEFSALNQLNSTDANARVTVTGGTDRVFISGQLCNILSYSGGSGDTLTYTVSINRYRGFPNNNPVNPDFIFDFEATVSEKVYTFTGLSGTGTLAEVETVFSTVVDSPDPAYYWYILEVEFDVTGSLVIDESEFNLRSLSAQVVKQ
jgi:hypothetical protein